MSQPTDRFRRNEKIFLGLLASLMIGGLVTASILGIQKEPTLQNEPSLKVDPTHPCASCYEDCIQDYGADIFERFKLEVQTHMVKNDRPGTSD